MKLFEEDKTFREVLYGDIISFEFIDNIIYISAIQEYIYEETYVPFFYGKVTAKVIYTNDRFKLTDFQIEIFDH